MDDFRASVAAGNFAEKGFPKSAYGMSKVGVSILTRIYAKTAPRRITVNSGDPGWCKTSMAGFERPPRTAAQGAETFVHMALVPDEQYANGQLWEDSKIIELNQSK